MAKRGSRKAGGPGFALMSPASAVTHARPYGRVWLITFTDLVALMLTFFVLLFSMSQIEQPKWQNLVDAFSTRLDSPHEVKIALPVADLDIEPVERVPATDLDYLDLILRERLLTESQLKTAVTWRQQDRIVISLPAALLFDGDSASLDAEAERVVFVLGDLLRKIDNRVEVAAHVDAGTAGDGAAALELSLSRAVAVAAMLKRAGYSAGVVTRGHGAAGRLPAELSLDQRARLEARVDVVVFADRAS